MGGGLPPHPKPPKSIFSMFFQNGFGKLSVRTAQRTVFPISSASGCKRVQAGASKGLSRLIGPRGGGLPPTPKPPKSIFSRFFNCLGAGTPPPASVTRFAPWGSILSSFLKNFVNFRPVYLRGRSADGPRKVRGRSADGPRTVRAVLLGFGPFRRSKLKALSLRP